MRVGVRRCASCLCHQAGGLLPRANFLVWSLEVGVRRRLNQRVFLVASDDGAFPAMAVGAGNVAHGPRLGFGHHLRQRLHAILIQDSHDCCAGGTGRGSLGTFGRHLKRERVYGVFARVKGVWSDVHRAFFFTLHRSLSPLFSIKKVEVE